MSGVIATTSLFQLFTGLLSFVFAILVVGTISLGLYLLFAPSDTLVVVYQNYHLRRSMRPLKDEDFRSPASVVRRMRSLGLLSLVVAAVLIVYMLRSFEVAA